MKKLSILVVLAMLFACGNNAGKLDQTKPESVVSAVFEAAKTGNFDVLEGLCDPLGEGDGDTKRICKVKSGDEEFRTKFVEFFKDGRVSGEPRINEGYARVPILFGPGATEEETFELVMREGKWYLYSL